MACSGSGEPYGERDEGVSWPPSDSLSRSASDDAPYFRGIDAALSGGSADPLGNALVLGPSSELSWSIYSLQGFGPDIDLASLELDFAVIPGNPDKGTALYVALANYDLQRWEWFESLEPQLTIDLEDFSPYYSPAGSVHLACVLGGNGSARIFGARFYRTGPGAAIPVPENLQGSAAPGSITLSWDSVPLVDGYHIYRALSSDFGSATKLNPSPATSPDYSDNTVAKNTDYYYWVTAVRGTESAPSVPVMVTSADTTVATPQNLQATASVGSVQLTWDTAAGATSYRLTRSRYADFSFPTHFTTANTSYTDASMSPPAQIYYYRVAGVGLEESEPSPGISVFIPTADLPAPGNFMAVDSRSDGDFVTLTWDYGANPAGFNIYFHEDPDFPLENLMRQISVAGNKRQHIEYGLPAEGGTLYCRICARDSDGKLGRMSDAVSFTNNPSFVFAPQESIGASANYPMVVASDGTQVTAAYFEGSNVRVAYRTGTSWTAGQSVGLNGNFGSYLDIAYGGNNFLVTAMQEAAGDCWASVGAGTSWSAIRIHGDGSTGDNHPVSGLHATATGSADEYGVVHVLSGSPSEVIVHTRATSGGAWTTTTATDLTAGLFDLSLAFHASDLYLGLGDYDTGDLLVGSRSGSYSLSAINQSPGDFICGHNLLGSVDGTLITPAANVVDSYFHFYREDSGSWSREDVFDTTSFSRADMAIFGERVIVTYMSPTEPHWYYAYFDGSGWSVSSIVTFPEAPSGSLGVVFQDTGLPYIVFTNVDGDLYGAPGFFL